jgi:hypothetical protein
VVSLSGLKLRTNEPEANSLSRAGLHTLLNSHALVEVVSRGVSSLAVVDRSEARAVSQRRLLSVRARNALVVLCRRPSNAVRGERRRASLFGSRRASRAGAPSTATLTVGRKWPLPACGSLAAALAEGYTSSDRNAAIGFTVRSEETGRHRGAALKVTADSPQDEPISPGPPGAIAPTLGKSPCH